MILRLLNYYYFSYPWYHWLRGHYSQGTNVLKTPYVSPLTISRAIFILVTTFASYFKLWWYNKIIFGYILVFYKYIIYFLLSKKYILYISHASRVFSRVLCSFHLSILQEKQMLKKGFWQSNQINTQSL